MNDAKFEYDNNGVKATVWISIDGLNYINAFRHYRQKILFVVGLNNLNDVEINKKFNKWYIKKYPENSEILKLI